MNRSFADKDYLEKAISLYSKSMIRAAYSITSNLNESEDIVQEVFFKLFRKQPVFNDPNHEKAWLLRVTINDAHNRMRQLKNTQLNESFTDGTVYFPDDDQRAVMAAVQSLDEKYRIVIHLHFYEGYTINEISKLLDIPSSTVGTRLERAKSKLKTILEPEVF